MGFPHMVGLVTSLFAPLAPWTTRNIIMEGLQHWKKSWPVNKEREEQVAL